MFQLNPKYKVIKEGVPESEAEIEFEKLFSGLLANGLLNPTSTVSKYDGKLDLSRTYQVSHACIWNDPLDVGRECEIVMKNSYIAVVAFDGDLSFTPQKFFWLEDLT